MSPMRWPRHIPWTTLPSGLARHQWRIGHSPRMRGDSTARRRADPVSSYPVSGIHPYDGSQEMEPPGNPVRFIVFVYRGDSTSADVGAEFFLNSHAEAY